jgi:hypothetical protein
MDGANAAERSPLLAEWRQRVTTAGHAPLEIPRVAFQGVEMVSHAQDRAPPRHGGVDSPAELSPQQATVPSVFTPQA